MRHYAVATIPGDGIGQDVIAAGIRALTAAQEVRGDVRLEFTSFPWSCAYYLEHGRMMPEDGLTTLAPFDAIYLGAVGSPRLVPDHVSLWGLLLPLRKGFDLYVNMRPCRLLPGLQGILLGKRPEDIDFVVLRENTEGAYAGVGGRVHTDADYEVAIQSIVFTRPAVERIMRHAFQVARRDGRKKVTSVTKSNSMQHCQVFWDHIFELVSADFPEIQTEQVHVDAMAARMVRNPESLDVVVASNLFGDILTDLAAALQGSLGLAPSANVNPDRKVPGFFEPVHGSAPDIAGKGIANPIAAIWAGALMLDYLGEREMGAQISQAIEAVTRAGKVLTPDLGGRATTDEVTDAICDQIRAGAALGA
ncbi:MAG: tartrate dehydrogenase [Chloroflexi bacterium]|nr:tartrate dehydrogenase [Chloroflexota bacterium]